MSISAIGLLIAFVIIVIIWFIFVAPAERRYHERKLRLMRERIRRRQQRLKEQQPDQQVEATELES